MVSNLNKGIDIDRILGQYEDGISFWGSISHQQIAKKMFIEGIPRSRIKSKQNNKMVNNIFKIAAIKTQCITSKKEMSNVTIQNQK